MEQELLYNTTDKKGVLGTLEGPCADTINATRNGRKYSDVLWTRVFKDPIIEEYFACGGIFGELGHPADRSETDMEKIAICMPEKPTKGDDGKLYGRWDILDTPNGRILKCLCDYGYKIGISSRGDGEVTEDWNGEETVEPESYSLNAFDAVLLPAVKEARLSLVTESYNKNNFKVALQESLDKATADARKIMEQTLDDLHIDYKKSADEDLGQETSEVESEKQPKADNDGVDILKNLQEALRSNRELKKKVNELNEKLSVSYAKEARIQRRANDLQDKLNVLQPKLDASTSLQESFNKAREVISSQDVKLSERDKSITTLKEQLSSKETQLNRSLNKVKFLEQRLESKRSRSSKLEDMIKTLKEELESYQKTDASNKQLREDFQKVRHEKQLIETSLQRRLDESVAELKRYKKMYNAALDKLIECKAEHNNLDVTTLRQSLKNAKSFSEIDSICESLSTRKRNLSKLPFPISNQEIKVKVPENPKSTFYNPNDEIEGLTDFL